MFQVKDDLDFSWHWKEVAASSAYCSCHWCIYLLSSTWRLVGYLSRHWVYTFLIYKPLLLFCKTVFHIQVLLSLSYDIDLLTHIPFSLLQFCLRTVVWHTLQHCWFYIFMYEGQAFYLCLCMYDMMIVSIIFKTIRGRSLVLSDWDTLFSQ